MTKQRGTFGYPGGKTLIRRWIINNFPEHKQYVEVFGGAGSVMVGKDRSESEVYNDVNSDCIKFFEAVKHHGEELAEWMEATPYSRELFERWTDEYPEWPDDIVEHAGRFAFIQNANFGGKLLGESSATYSVNKADNTRLDKGGSKVWAGKPDDIRWLTERFKAVNIEHLDFQELMNKYDKPGAFYYCDPPYIDVGDGYYNTEDAKNNNQFDHGRFIDTLLGLENAEWLVSYDHNIPEPLDEYHTIARTKTATMSDQLPEKTETLTMSFDPNETTMFRDNNQRGLEAYSD